MLARYNKFVRRYPIMSQALQCSALVATGDIIAQTCVEKKSLRKGYQWERTVQFAAVGFCVVGPALTKWYGLLDKLIGNKGKTAALKKVACDQLLFAPCFMGIFLTSLGIAQKRTPSQIKTSITDNYKDILITNYKLWPATQLLNFYFVPLQYQVLVVQFVALFWNTYLSMKTQQNVQLD